MAEEGRVEQTVRRTLQAQVQFYEALGRASLGFVKALGEIWIGQLAPFQLGPFGASSPPPATPEGAVARTSPPGASAPTPPSPPALVLAAAAGQEASGVFLVANQLPRRVSAPVVISPFVDSAGHEVQPTFRIEPEVVTLDPGGQALLQIVVQVGEELKSGTDYRAAISVPGLSESRVALLLRRIASPPEPEPVPAPEKRAKGAAPARKPRKKNDPAPATVRKSPPKSRRRART